jgi:hypothetical protein
MLRNVIDEIVRRRLWPIAAVAVLVMVAAPLLFLRPAPRDAAPAAAAEPAPVPAPAGDDLPARAQRLLESSDALGKRGRGLSRTPRDPFQPPAGHRAATPGSPAPASASARPAAGSASGGSERPAPIPVVVTNAGGASPARAAARATVRTERPRTREREAPRARRSDAPSVAAVDVRFGARKDSRLRRRIARLRAFRAGGKVVAVFVKYSPRRDKAVFAIAPTTTVRGPVKCRRKDGLCRYVDIPAGSYVRLTALAADGSLVSRRLDVVRVHDDR